jgi:hypothetical protein
MRYPVPRRRGRRRWFRWGEIEKVPSDLQDNLFSGRHARPEHGAQKRRDVCPQLPAAGFAQRRITALVRIRNSAFGGSSPLDTAFH